MSRLSIPIESTNLTDVIPEGDSIIYSTDLKADLFALRPYVSGSTFTSGKWQTHFLISESGIAYFSKIEKVITDKGKEKIRIRSKAEGLIPVFFSWKEIEHPGLGSKNTIQHRIFGNKKVAVNFKNKYSGDIGWIFRGLWKKSQGLRLEKTMEKALGNLEPK